MEIPVDDGGRLLVEVDESQLPDELELAAALPGQIVARARESLERSLDQLEPALTSLARRLRAMTPDTFTLEFGLTMNAEYGLVMAKGSGEVHLEVTLSWHREATPKVPE